MKYTIGQFSHSVVEVTNRQKTVEYKIISGFESEQSVRSHVGNYGKGLYCTYYSGHYSERKECLKRMQSDIDDARKALEELEFAMKVTKKRNWVKID